MLSPAATPGAFSGSSAGMIVLFTDFGLAGPYTGQMKAVLRARGAGRAGSSISSPTRRPATRAPRPISSPLMPRGFRRARCSSASSIPASAARARRSMVEADRRWYVGPENGLFELVLRRAQPPCDGRDHLAAATTLRELPRPRSFRAGRGDAGARRAPPSGATRDAEFAAVRLARRSRRDRLYRPLRQRHDRAARQRRCRRRDADLGHRRPRIAHARTFSAVGEGEALLVREFQRPRRDRGQSAAVPTSALGLSGHGGETGRRCCSGVVPSIETLRRHPRPCQRPPPRVSFSHARFRVRARLRGHRLRRRRGRARAAGRAGGRRRGDPRPAAHAAARCATSSTIRRSSAPRRARSLRAAAPRHAPTSASAPPASREIDRINILQRDARRDAPRRRCAGLVPDIALIDGNVAAAAALPGQDGDRRRRALAVDRRRLGHRQGDARPAHARARRALSPAMAGRPMSATARPSIAAADGAGPDAASPPLLRSRSSSRCRDVRFAELGRTSRLAAADESDCL